MLNNNIFILFYKLIYFDEFIIQATIKSVGLSISGYELHCPIAHILTFLSILK
jgi:hypothetical protein